MVVDLKRCKTCDEAKPLSEFRYRQARDYYHPACTSCEKIRDSVSAKKRWAEDKETLKKIRKAYNTSSSVKAVAYRARHLLKRKKSGQYAATSAVYVALKKGIIFKKKMCASCFSENIKTGFHHFKGYAVENRLDVVELCYGCHYEAHKDPNHEYYPQETHGLHI